MTDQGKARDLNEAAARFAETLADSYRLVYDQAAESGERQKRLAQEFSDLVATNSRSRSRQVAPAPNSSPNRRAGSRKPGKSSRESQSGPTRSSLTTPSPATGPCEQVVGSVQEGAMASGRSAAGLLGTATGAVTDATGRTLGATAEEPSRRQRRPSSR